jgi:pyruvate/2-oxoglutarate dehydrogenase complex dihydrolipoamide dehydrogenase (E3) component
VLDVLVVGAGPAGVVAALRAGDLGAKTALVTRAEFGGMAANDGPVPVRTLAQAARLLREARQLGRYGISVSEPVLEYPRLLERVREVVADVRAHSVWREQIETTGVTVHEGAGEVRFLDSHTLVTGSGQQFQAEKIVLCTGGSSRRLSVPGAEATSTHSDAWGLREVPPSMIVIGGGATGVQVASIFSAFGTRVQLFQSGPRILPTEDEDVSREVAEAFRRAGMIVREGFGAIDSFEKTASGIRMHFSKGGARESVEAALAVVAVGWVANSAGLDLPKAGVETTERGFVRVDEHQQTSASHVYAAGDITGRLLLVPQAIQEGFVAGTNAVRGPLASLPTWPVPVGSFTDPEYAQVGLTEAAARAKHDVLAEVVRFDSTTRTIIDGRSQGFCKLVVDRATSRILGCHVVGERAVEITQVAALAMSGGLRVDDLARVPLSFPTYAGILGRLAARAAHQLNLKTEDSTQSAEF